ncbi:MAG: hypothetical protein JXB85_00585 [Anaerolineales bacterium]|nr:hypothetical protein [Anaerolineales bacterium]
MEEIKQTIKHQIQRSMMAARKNVHNPIDLPRRPEEWVVAVRQMRYWIENDEGNIVRPFLCLGINLTSGMILFSDIGEALPAPEKVGDLLDKAMQKPARMTRQKPGRPEVVHFEQPEFNRALTEKLSAVAVGSDHQAGHPMVDEVIMELEDTLRGEEPLPGLLSIAGVELQLLEDLFSAAASFFRAQPWICLADSQPLAVEFVASGRTIYIQLMGNAGVDYGFVVYPAWEDLVHVYQAVDHPTERIPNVGWISFSYAEAHYLPFSDLDAIEQYDWEVAGKGAYPLPVVYYPDRVERPDVEMLGTFIEVMRAVMVFLELHLQEDGRGGYLPAEAQVRVTSLHGERDLMVRFPAGELPLDRQPLGPALCLDDPDEEDEDLPVVDRRALEGDMAAMLGGGVMGFKDPDVRKAQELMYQTWNEYNPARRIVMAHQALSISPDCADAYVLLAEEEADTLLRAAELYRQGMQAGERALGKKMFKEARGHFWGILETRPYMRARAGLANCLWGMGKTEEAKEHYSDMLRLNPNDNQGIRYTLLSLLLETRSQAEVDALLDEYDGDYSPDWLYTRALILFRQEGGAIRAGQALDAAIEQNRYVLSYLVGEKPIPVHLPETIEVGGETEAIAYASGHLNHWRRTRGAVEWLRERFDHQKEGGPVRPRPQKRRPRHPKKK